MTEYGGKVETMKSTFVTIDEFELNDSYYLEHIGNTESFDK